MFIQVLQNVLNQSVHPLNLHVTQDIKSNLFDPFSSHYIILIHRRLRSWHKLSLLLRIRIKHDNC